MIPLVVGLMSGFGYLMMGGVVGGLVFRRLNKTRPELALEFHGPGCNLHYQGLRHRGCDCPRKVMPHIVAILAALLWPAALVAMLPLTVAARIAQRPSALNRLSRIDDLEKELGL